MKIDNFNKFNERFITDMILSKVDNILRKLKSTKNLKIYGGKMYDSESDKSYGFEMNGERVTVFRIPDNGNYLYKLTINGDIKNTSNSKAERIFHQVETKFELQD